MIFKNAVVFRFTKRVDFEKNLDELVDRLQDEAFTPVQSSQTASTGWVPALSGDDAMVFSVNDCLFLRLRKDEKVLKSSAINREVNDKVKAIEKQEGRRVGKKEREQIKDDVIATHLPHALIESKYTTGYIDLQEQSLVVDASTPKAAEDFASFLRKTLGSLPVRPLTVELAPGFVLTGTLDPNTGAYLTRFFELGDECTMRGLDGEKASFKEMDLTSDEVVHHITDGQMAVTALRLSAGDRVAFTVTEDLVVKKIKFLDGFHEQVLEVEPEDEDRDAGVSFATVSLTIMVADLRQIFSRLVEAMGGLAESFDPLEDL